MKITNLPEITPSGAETLPVVKDGKSGRTSLAALMASVGQPYIDAAHLSADRAAAFALMLEATTAGGWFESLAAGAATVAESEGFFVNDGTSFYTGKRVGGVGVKMASFAVEYPYEIDIRKPPYNAKGDAWRFSDGTIDAGALDRITFANARWKASAVTVGNPIFVKGAGVGGGPLITTIAGVLAPDTILLADHAAAPVVSATGELGTNDRPAIQQAINDAHAMGGAQVTLGGRDQIYLLAGEPASFGTFQEPDNSASPFPRGMLQLLSHVSLCGDGATIVVSGGRRNPPGIFYNDFWTAPTLLENVRITGLVLDGNVQNQVMTVYAPNPTNLNGTGVWQHGCAVTVAAGRKIEVDHCVFRDLRGDAFRFFKNDNLDPSQSISFHHNELDGIFTQGVGGIGIGVWIYNNWFHGDGYWVAGIDFESLDHHDELRDAWVYNNVFDFRDGLSPVERTPQFASDSVEALAARRHLRRAISIAMYADSYPGNIYNGNLGRVTFAGNKIYQGVIDIAKFADVTVQENHVFNTYEDVTGHILISTDAIGFSSDLVAGLGRLEISHNLIDSDLEGIGVNLYRHPDAWVHHNSIRNVRGAGVTFNATSGSVTDNMILNAGRVPGAVSLPLRFQTGVYVVGRFAGPVIVADNTCIENRSGDAAKMQCAVFTNSDGADIRDNVGAGMLSQVIIENVAGRSRIIGNHDAANIAAPWQSSAPVNAPAIAASGSVTAGENVTAGGDMVAAGAVTASDNITGSGMQALAKAAGDTIRHTWLSPIEGGGKKVHYQWTVSTADNSMTLNQFDPATGLVSNSILIVNADGTVVLASTGLRIRPGPLPVFADNAAAVAGGLAGATLYRTPTGQVQIVY